jgi:hypothetical protein
MRWICGVTGDPPRGNYPAAPERPKTAADAAAMMGNDPSRAAEMDALVKEARSLVSLNYNHRALNYNQVKEARSLAAAEVVKAARKELERAEQDLDRVQVCGNSMHRV